VNGGGLTDDGDVLALVGDVDPGEQLDAGERGHDDLREHEVEGVGAVPHHSPRLHPVRHRRHCRLRERERKRETKSSPGFPLFPASPVGNRLEAPEGGWQEVLGS
jgi:hypothetical protein